MDIKNAFARVRRAAGGYGGVSTAMVALFIAVTVVLNMIVYGLAERFGWYAYTTEKYEHTIGDATESYFAPLVNEDTTVRIRFCMAEDGLKADVANALVYNTARQLAAKYDFIEVEYLNIYLDPAEVNQYRFETDPETGERTEIHAISTESVIIDNGENPTDFTVLAMSSFFVLDERSTVLAYKGEEVMAAMIHRVLTEEHSTVYFTRNHGETSSATFYNLLVCAGYDVKELDLRANAVPEDAAIIVISNPLYDFEQAQAGSGIVSEIDRLEGFLAGGGMLYVMLDPLVGELPHLDALLADWGMVRENATVRDVSRSLSSDGLTLLTEYGKGASASRIGARVNAANDGSVVLKSASPIKLTKTGAAGATTETVLASAAGSAAYAGGKQVSSTGNYTLAALSRGASGGSIFLVSSIFLTARDAIQTNGYANADLLYALFEEVSGASVPLGCSVLSFDTERLEGLTMGTAHLLTVLLVAVIPLGVLTVGAVIRIRRKNR